MRVCMRYPSAPRRENKCLAPVTAHSSTRYAHFSIKNPGSSLPMVSCIISIMRYSRVSGSAANRSSFR